MSGPIVRRYGFPNSRSPRTVRNARYETRKGFTGSDPSPKADVDRMSDSGFGMLPGRTRIDRASWRLLLA